MKRLNNLYEQIYSIDNLILANQNARKGKSMQVGVKKFDKDSENNLQALHEMLVNKTYTTSTYSTFKIYEPKERIISRLPYFPDRICHHAIMNILEPIFVASFTTDTYSCIKGKGILDASTSVKKALRDTAGTHNCLKLDIKKFYPNIDHVILKQLLRKKFKDQDLLWLLDGIIDSSPGIPIGNYLSQYFANFYLTYFDHWIKQELKVKYYFRYADDIVILSEKKADLHYLLWRIDNYLKENLNLQIKENYQIFPVDARSLDFVGYRHYHTHTLLRKTIKQNFARMLKKRHNLAQVASYKGWAKHCNSINLLKKLLGNEKI